MHLRAACLSRLVAEDLCYSSSSVFVDFRDIWHGFFALNATDPCGI